MESAEEALASTGNDIAAVALSGRPYPGSKLAKVSVVEGIDYMKATSGESAETLVDRMEEAACEALAGSPDVWHLHNHSLGKNPAFSEAVRLLAAKGRGMLLHLHDFAEDGRPSNYAALRDGLSDIATIYPTGPRIRYAALNRRDASFLVDAGLPEEQLVLLPNPVKPILKDESQPIFDNGIPDNLVLCPVRAVRRKNLGELALLAAAHPELTFANTLGPTNPAYRTAFDRWKKFAKDLKLSVRYAIAEETDTSFPELVASARSLITTSVGEGFGLAFLEPWMQGKLLAGRDLPEITGDFSKAGLDLGHLYQRIELPVDLIDANAFRLDVESILGNLFAAYGKPLPANGADLAIEAMAPDDRVDFGRLHEPPQEILVRAIHSSTSLADEVRRQVKLSGLSMKLVSSNAEVVTREYGLSAYGQKLRSVYEEIAGSEGSVSGCLDAEVLLAAFLKPQRLFLLRS